MMKNCLICKKIVNEVETESPSGYWICGECGCRGSSDKGELVITKHGYYFQEFDNERKGIIGKDSE